MKKGSWLAGRALPGKFFRMHIYTNAGLSRNSRNPSKPANHEPELTNGGRAVKRRRPAWSHSLCNAVGALAGIGQEATHAQ
jgi:hypothetical protein